MAKDNDWLRLRSLLAVSVTAMAWRLEKLSEVERLAFLDELTDRLIASIQTRRPD